MYPKIASTTPLITGITNYAIPAATTLGVQNGGVAASINTSRGGKNAKTHEFIVMPPNTGSNNIRLSSDTMRIMDKDRLLAEKGVLDEGISDLFQQVCLDGPPDDPRVKRLLNRVEAKTSGSRDRHTSKGFGLSTTIKLTSATNYAVLLHSFAPGAVQLARS